MKKIKLIGTDIWDAEKAATELNEKMELFFLENRKFEFIKSEIFSSKRSGWMLSIDYEDTRGIFRNDVNILSTIEWYKNRGLKRFVLVAKGGSGKDFARKILQENGYEYAVTCTTRPKRNTEEDGKDYFFIDDTNFNEMENSAKFYEAIKFNNWGYGTTNETFYGKNLFIMTPSGISKIKDEDRRDTCIVYFDIPEKLRRKRLAARGDADSVDRRIIADDTDFRDFNDYDVLITDPYFK